MNTPPTVPTDENQIIAERRGKLAELRARGVAFPNDFVPTDRAGALHDAHDAREPTDFDDDTTVVSIAGRMMLKRVMGKASFATVKDGSGAIQLYVQTDAVGPEAYADFKRWDLGDIVAATGTLFKTRTGELSIKATTIRLLTKSLRPLPDKFHGLADQEVKYRQRYVDLITSDETRRTFVARSAVLSAIRGFMTGHAFLEVETPMLHPIPGGAAAKPFFTHHNALDMQMSLRIAPELYLKRLIVGGFERVFEVNRNFRNEGVSPRHNPEFTMLEFYAAYTDYRWLMGFTESLIRDAAVASAGSATLTYQGRPLDLSKPFERLTITGAIRKHFPEYRDEDLADVAYLRAALKEKGADIERAPLKDAGLGASSSRCSRRLPRACCGSRPTSSTTRSRCRRSRASRTPGPASPSASSCSSPGARSRTVSPNSTTPRTRPRGSAARSRRKRPATRKRCTTTPTTCARSNTACRRPAAAASGSTGS